MGISFKTQAEWDTLGDLGKIYADKDTKREARFAANRAKKKQGKKKRPKMTKEQAQIRANKASATRRANIRYYNNGEFKTFKELQEEYEVTEWFITKEGKEFKSSPMEDMIAGILVKIGTKYKREVSFRGLNPTGAKKGWLRFDFFIPDHRVCIEYDGAQWHKATNRLKYDKLKTDYCLEHNIHLLRLTKNDLSHLQERIEKALRS